jgi:hypothetical protein
MDPQKNPANHDTKQNTVVVPKTESEPEPP